MGFCKNSTKRKLYSNTVIPQEARKVLNKQPTSTSKAAGKRKTKTPKVSRMKEVIKIRAEINEKEMKETIVKINKTKNWFFDKANKIDKPFSRLIKKKRRIKSTNLEKKRRGYNRQCRNTKEYKRLL